MKVHAQKHFYAQVCQYGVNTLSDADILVRFTDRAQRDDFVADSCRAEAISAADARRRYDLRQFGGEECKYFVDTEHYETCGIICK